MEWLRGRGDGGAGPMARGQRCRLGRAQGTPSLDSTPQGSEHGSPETACSKNGQNLQGCPRKDTGRGWQEAGGNQEKVYQSAKLNRGSR